MRLLVTRPQPDADALAETLRKHGHDVLVHPLIEIVLEPENLPSPHQVQALIATSKNGLRALKESEHFKVALRLPLFSVGNATSAYARELGFSSIRTGPGTGKELVKAIASERKPEDGPLLHLAGEIVNCDLKQGLEALGFEVLSPTVYRAVAAEVWDRQTLNRMKSRQIDGVILLSPRTALIFSQLVLKYDLSDDISAIKFYCLSTAVAEALDGPGKTQLRIANQPTLEDVLELI